jgi:hypothetical protein
MIPAKNFVLELKELLRGDPITSYWLMPLHPLLSISYRARFDTIADEACYLVFDDKYTGGHAWLTAQEYYDRSKVKASDLARLRLIPAEEHLEPDLIPTGA